MSESEIRLTVPSGFRAGPYDVVVTNPGGEADILHNGFLACERRELTCALEPLLDITPPGFERGPVSWWMTLEGDEVFFEPKVRHEGIVLLAELGPAHFPASTSRPTPTWPSRYTNPRFAWEFRSVGRWAERRVRT